MNHFLSPQRPGNQWAYLFLFLISNSLIAYAGLSGQTQIFLGLFGIALPLYVALRTTATPPPREKASYETDLKLSSSVWFLAAGVLLAVGLRFYKLETLFCWPTLDEGWNGTLAIELSKHWTWRFFYTFGEAPPLPVWCAALLFKCGCEPAFCLWFPSALVSLLTAGVGFLAARRYFSRSFALVCGGLLAFSYWPLYIGRFCHQGIWLPLWICLFLYAWRTFSKFSSGSSKKKWALLLGLALGFGSFTFTPWLGIAGILFGFTAWQMVGSKKKDWENFSIFSGAFFFALLPFLLAVAREGYGRHITSLSPWGGWFESFHIFTGYFKYFAVLVWGSFEKDPAYTPLSGGFLNPLLGSFFFWGVIEMFRLRRFKLVQWAAAAFWLFLLPGALSPNLETFRIAQVMPLLLFITALGFHAFLKNLPSPKQGEIFILCLALSTVADFNLLAAPYQNPNDAPENFGRPLKSLDRYHAWQLLEEAQERNGPGMILTDFDTDSFNDPTLSVMTYPFNAGRNPSLDAPPPAWTAVFVNVHYQSFLEKNLPGGEWYWVSKNLHQENGGNTLGIIPSNRQNQGRLAAWARAHESFQRTDILRFSQKGENFDEILRSFESGYPLMRGEPLLESVFWDKRAAFEYKKFNYDQHLLSYRMAVTRGYPTAELYDKMGILLLEKGRVAEAREALIQATRSPLDLTNARDVLKALKANPPKNALAPSR